MEPSKRPAPLDGVPPRRVDRERRRRGDGDRRDCRQLSLISAARKGAPPWRKIDEGAIVIIWSTPPIFPHGQSPCIIQGGEGGENFGLLALHDNFPFIPEKKMG